MRFVVGGSLALGGLLVVYGALTGRLAPMIAALVRPTDLISDDHGVPIAGGGYVAGTGDTPDVPANPLGKLVPAPLTHPD